MAKDDRTIVSNVRMPAGDGPRRTFGPGDEDELASAADQATLDRLVEDGALSGTWKAAKKSESKKSEK